MEAMVEYKADKHYEEESRNQGVVRRKMFEVVEFR